MEKEKWGFRSHPTKAITLIVVLALVGTLFGVVMGSVLNKADAAVTCTSSGSTNCGTVTKKHRRVKNRIQDGVIPKSGANFDLRDAFKKKRAAKRWYVNHIMAALVASKGSTSARTGVSRAYARSLYVRTTSDPWCGSVATGDNWMEFYNSQNMCDFMAQLSDTGDPRWISKKEIQVFGFVGLCGTTVALGVASSAATFGMTAAAAVSSASSCALGLWTQLDPG